MKTMGRRLFFVLGMVLLIAWGPARVLGQDGLPAPGPGPAADFDAEDPLGEPEPGPSPLLEADDPDEPSPSPAAAPADLPDEIEPAGLPPARMQPVDAPRDENVERVQAPAGPPAGAATSLEGGFLQPLDRLPLGKHEVLVSVEVQAPPAMNLNKENTVKIVVVNSGSSDALDVVVRDELPPGLKFISSTPPPEAGDPGLLTWRLGTVPHGTPRVITMQVVPTQVAPLDHAATVTFRAGSKARTQVLEPKLRVEVTQAPSIPTVLKGKQTEFRISVTNVGDGPARGVLVLAKLSPGLKHESGESNDQNSFDIPIEGLGPFERRDLPPLIVDAVGGGRQTCTVKATSPDVVFDPAQAEIERFVDVVEPQIKLDLVAPEKRFTETAAAYELTVSNPGTAPAKNVQINVALPISGRLMADPPEAKFDRSKNRLVWTIPELPVGEAPRTLKFEVMMGGVGFYEVTAEARAENVQAQRVKRTTDVQGMADLDVLVTEKRRAVDVGGETTFVIRIDNYGTKEARNVQVRAELSPNLQVTETSGGPEQQAKLKDNQILFPTIESVGTEKPVLLGIKVKALKGDDGIGVLRVFIKDDEMAKELQGMANIKVTEGRRTADASSGATR